MVRNNPQAKIGDILKFSHFAWSLGAQNNAEPPLWGRVTKVEYEVMEVQYLSGGDAELREWVADDADEELTVDEDYDCFEIVPEDDVPAQVWADVAYRELTGECHADQG